MVALSRACSSSEHCLRELETIVVATTAGKPSLVLPVRVDDSPLPETIRSVAALDARGISEDDVARRIAARIEATKRMTADEPVKAIGSALGLMTEGDRFELLAERADFEIARLKQN